MLIGCGCNCGDQSESSIPSESIPSEQSQDLNSESVGSGAASESASSGEESDVAGCIPCSESLNFRPAALRVSWGLVDRAPGIATFGSYPGMGNCYSDYTGPFTVRYDSTIPRGYTEAIPSGLPSGAIICSWHSADIAGGRATRSHDCAIPGGSNAKASVWVQVTGSAPLRVWQVIALISWDNTSGGVRNYGSPGETGSRGGITYTKLYRENLSESLNCFGTHTLSFSTMPGRRSLSFEFIGGPGFNYELNVSGTRTNTFPGTITVEAL
jgi:hypothetical protein